MEGDKTMELSKAQQSLIMVLDIVGKGEFEKKESIYIIKTKVLEGYIIHVTEKAIELRIITTKWIKGSYEPIRSSEIYRSVSYNQLTNLSYEEKIKKIESIIKEKGI